MVNINGVTNKVPFCEIFEFTREEIALVFEYMGLMNAQESCQIEPMDKFIFLHGDEQEVGQQGTARHVILVQHVTTEGCERKTEECTNDSCDDGVQERTEQFRRCEDRLVTAEGRIIRPELETVDTDSVEGVGYNFPDRNNDNQGKNCEDDIKNYIKCSSLFLHLLHLPLT